MESNSFQNVMKQWHRMCKANRDDCTNCEIYKKSLRKHCCFCNKDTLNEILADGIEIIVMSWAAEHPEPVYPSVAKYLEQFGIIIRRDGSLEADFFKANEPMSADIAQKLGIEPKEET